MKRKRLTTNYYCSYCDDRAKGIKCERCGNHTCPYPVEDDAD